MAADWQKAKDEAYEMGFKDGKKGTYDSSLYPRLSVLLPCYQEGYRHGIEAKNRDKNKVPE